MVLDNIEKEEHQDHVVIEEKVLAPVKKLGLEEEVVKICKNFKVGYYYRMSNKCKQCNRVGSFLLKCKCGNCYCTKHLLPEVHFCTEMQAFKKEAYEKNEKKLLEASKKEKPEWMI